MPFIDTADLRELEPLEGWTGRLVHSENMSFMHYTVAATALPIPLHAHPQEEVWTVIEGELEVTIDGTTRKAGAGSVAVVPSGVPHAIRVIEKARAIVVNYPVRRTLSGK